MRILLIILLSFVVQSSFASRGLGLYIYTQYLRFENKPIKRIGIRTEGDKLSYKERRILQVRKRITPMLTRFKSIVEFSKKNGVNIIDYNPTLKETFVDLKNNIKLDDIIFPQNLVFKLKTGLNEDLAFVTFSFQTAPKKQDLENLYYSIENLFKLKLKVDEKRDIKIKRLDKKSREILEPIRKREVSFMKYYSYYGLRIDQTIWIENSYFKQFKDYLKGEFAKTQQDFKYYFFKSKDIDIAIKKNYLFNLEKAIEDEGFDDLATPFKKVRLPEIFVKHEYQKNNFNVRFIFARGEDHKFLDPILQNIINQTK